MTFNFPNSPSAGQNFTPVAGLTFTWDGAAWRSSAQGSPATVRIADAPPLDPLPGQLWWESDTGDLFIWYVDADSSQWVQVNAAPPSATETLIYDTATQMQFTSVPDAVNAVRTNGYAIVGDGGAALYKRVGSSPAHAGKFQTLDGAWWSIADKKLTPRMYGAKSDGSDSLAAFTAWAADVSAGLGWGSIDHETYNIAGEIPLTGSKIDIECHGTFVQMTANKATFRATGIAGLRFMGGDFVGKGTGHDGVSTSLRGDAAIRCDSNCTDVLISGLRGENHDGGFIVFTEGCRDVTVENCRSIGMGAGVIAQGDNGSDCGIQFRNGTLPFDNVLIRGNSIREHAFGIFMSGGENRMIYDNIIEDIRGQHGIYCANIGSLAIHGNRIRNMALLGLKSQLGTAADNLGQVVISDNSIEKTGSWGILVESVGSATGFKHRNLVVQNNHIATSGKLGTGADGAINISDARGFQALNNTSRDSMGYGLFMTGCAGLVDGFTSIGSERSALFVNPVDGDVKVKNLVALNACLNTVGLATEGYVYPVFFASQVATKNIDLQDVRVAYTSGADWAKPWTSGEIAGVADWRSNASGLVYRCTVAGGGTLANEPVHTVVGASVAGADGYTWQLLMNGEPATLQYALRASTNVQLSLRDFQNDTVSSFGLLVTSRRHIASDRELFSQTVPLTGGYIEPFRVIKTNQAAATSPGWELTTGGAAHTGLWAVGATYVAGVWYRNAAGRVYRLTTAGGGVTANEPVHTSGSVTGADGYAWKHMNAAAARWSPLPVLAAVDALP